MITVTIDGKLFVGDVDLKLTSKPVVGPPIDCVLGEWGAWQFGPWSACVNGLRTRTETRTRAVVTPPANGGAECGPTFEMRTVSEPCVVEPPPVEISIPPLGSFSDAKGAIWSLVDGGAEPGDYPMRDGAHVGGRVDKLIYRNNTVFGITPDGAEWEFKGERWVKVGEAPPVDPPPVDPPPVDPPPIDPQPDGPLPTYGLSQMVYKGWRSTGGFAFIKHTPGLSSSDKYVRAFGGDLNQGTFPLDENAPVRQVGLTAPIRWDTSDDALPMEQLCSRFGNKADGTAPHVHDGCTTVWTGAEFLSGPGFQAPYNAANDPHGIMRADISRWFRFNEASRSWSAGVMAGGQYWGREKWDGAYHKASGLVWELWDNGTESGALRSYDRDAPDEATAYKVYQLRPRQGIDKNAIFNWTPWQSVMIGDVMYWPDFYNGWLWSVNVAHAANMPAPFKVARIPKYHATEGEPIGTIEAGVAVSERLRKVWIGYSPAKYTENGASAIYEIDVDTGRGARIPFPDEMGPEGDFKRMATMLAFSDATLTLLATGNSDETWASRFLVYKFSNVVIEPPKPPEEINKPLSYLRGVGEAVIAPNSVALNWFVDRTGINPAFLERRGLRVPQTDGDIIHIPPNENGVTPQQLNGQPAQVHRTWNEFRSFSANWWDYTTGGKISPHPVTAFCVGDSGTGINDVWAYEFSNEGGWLHVVEGTHVSKFRNAGLAIENAAALANGRAIDQRPYKHLDGVGMVGAHRYQGSHYNRVSGLGYQVGTNNRYPTDTGRNREVCVWSAEAKMWLYGDIEAPCPDDPDDPRTTSTETPATTSDKRSGRVYALRRNSLCVLDPVSHTWNRTLLRDKGVLDDGCIGYAWDGDYVLAAVNDTPVLNESDPLHWFVVERGVSKTCAIVGPAAEWLDFTKHPWLPRYAAFEWVPPWNAFAMFTGFDDHIYRVRRESEFAFHVEIWAKGVFPAASDVRRDVAGGVLSKMGYIESGSDMALAYHPSDATGIILARAA